MRAVKLSDTAVLGGGIDQGRVVRGKEGLSCGGLNEDHVQMGEGKTPLEALLKGCEEGLIDGCCLCLGFGFGVPGCRVSCLDPSGMQLLLLMLVLGP